MNSLRALVQREWMQHRFGWALMALVPFTVAILVLTLAKVDLETDIESSLGPAVPAMLTIGSLAVSAGVTLLILWGTSLVFVAGLARRDHGDRSIEFWLSMPVGHARSLAMPLLVHLLLVPLAALAAGLLGGVVISFVLVSRAYGIGEWVAVPWGVVLPAALAAALRVAAGIVLATLWLSPLILLLVLAGAWFKRWALPVLGVAFAVANFAIKSVTGQEWLSDAAGELLRQAGASLVVASPKGLSVLDEGQLTSLLPQVPGAAAADLGLALQSAWSPLMAGALLVAAASFGLLVHWRQRGA